MKRLWVAVGLALATAGIVGACDSGHPLPASTSMGGPDGSIGHVDRCATPGQEGCPCSEEGEAVECGKQVTRADNYVTCSMGHSRCEGGSWSACVGNRIVSASLPGMALGMGGLHPMATSGMCTDPCNPYDCTTVTGSTKDITDPGVNVTDAGVSIPVGSAPAGPACYGLFCQRQECATAGVTTNITGTVYDPAGKNPLYNASVYIPVDATAALPAFTDGASCDTCAGAGTLTVVALAQTGADGKFTLTNVPVGSNIPLVVQMGQWRRKVTLPTITACVDNAIDKAYTRLPKNRFDGDNNQADIPKIAIAAGSADPFECMLLKAGIDPAEIDVPSKGTRIQYYNFNGKDRDPGGAPAGSTLTSNLAKMKGYDAIILPCEGGEKNHNADAQNLQAYANAGGRAFITHYGYSWLATPSPTKVANNMTDFYGTADWSKLDVSDYSDPTAALIDTTFPKGAAFAQWLQNIAATTTLGAMSITEPRHDALTAIKSQRWMYGWNKNLSHALAPDMLLAMTFNTPVNSAAASQCGRVVFSDFHVSAAALVSGSSCKATSDCGYSSTCTGASSGTCSATQCGSATDCPTGFSCVGAATTGTCTPTSCTLDSQCNNNNCSGSLCQCTNSNQCGSGLCTGQCAAQTCNAASDCGTSEACSGAVAGACGQKTCTQNSDCASGSCVSGKCTCSGNTQCGSGTCLPSLGSCTAKTCYDGAQCGAAEVCNGTAGNCGAKACTSNAQCGGGTCVAGSCTCTANSQCISGSTCTNRPNKACAEKSCTSNANCGTSETCDTAVGLCKPKPCSATVPCGSSSSCVSGFCTCTANSACGTGGSCVTVGDCTAHACVNNACGGAQTCNGAVSGSCNAEPCTTDSQCGSGRCISGTCACGANADCGSGTCANMVRNCTAKSCVAATTTGCGSVETCSGATAGACTGRSCTTATDCNSSTNAACVNGKCECRGAAGVGTTVCGGRTCDNRDCTASTCAYKCGTSETCVGGTPGTCQKACTADADCTKGTCVGGQCVGCYSSADCSASGATCSGSLGTCTPSSMFPQSCKQGNLSAQEAALEFMLFDLTACVSPDSGQPPVPPVSLNPATFTLDFSGMCPAGQTITWRSIEWQSAIPSSASIVFKAQTADDLASFATAQSVTVATATSSTPLGGWDMGLINFSSASPAIASKNNLRVTVTLNPTSDKVSSPSLSQWRVLYDCSTQT
jgi:hypothetical protein